VNRTDKSVVIDRLRDSLASVPAIVVVDFQGLAVEHTDKLRSQLRQAGVHYEVVKNTLAKAAIAGSPKASMEKLLKGNSAIAYHPEDPSTAAKIMRDFAKDNDKLKIRGGWVDGTVLDAAGVQVLATLPGKDELRARLLSVFNGVPTKFVRTLNAASSTFVQLLTARTQQLESDAA
jgi:large subunit ribosomal protein L10